MFGLRSGGLVAKGDIYWLREYWIVMLAGIIFSTPIFKKVLEKTEGKNADLDKVIDALVVFGSIVFFCVSLSYLAISAHNPFIYFNF